MLPDVVRIIFGFIFVMLLPGFSLTLALWPNNRRVVYRKVLNLLGEKGIGESTILGKVEDARGLVEFLEENSIEIKEMSQTIIIAGALEGPEREIDTEGKTVIDLGNNFDGAIKIENTIDGIERLALSVGLSIAMVPLIGLILNFTSFGIRFESVFVSLSLVIILFFAIYYKRTKSWDTSKS